MSNWSAIPAGTRSARVAARRGTEIRGALAERIRPAAAPAGPPATPTNVSSGGSITTADIRAKSIRSELVASEVIRGEHIVAATITADLLSVTQLSAITADLGTITAGTITGAVFQTAAASPRVVIDSTGITMTEPGGQTTFFANAANGQLTLGDPGGAKIVFDPALTVNQQLYLEGRLVGTGTILGPSFLTNSSPNARLQMDSNGLFVYDSSNVEKYRVTVADGVVARTDNVGSIDKGFGFWDGTNKGPFLSGSISGANYAAYLRTHDGSVVSRNGYATVKVLSNGTTLNSASIDAHSGVGGGRFSTLTVASDGSNEALTWFSSGGAALVLDSTSGNDSFVRSVVGRNLFVGDISNPINVLNGKAIFANDLHIAHDGGGQTVYAAFKGVAAAANNQWGSVVNWRHVRTNSAGGLVNPASITIGGVTTNTNCTSPQWTTLFSRAAIFKVQATAAGSFEYFAACTIN